MSAIEYTEEDILRAHHRGYPRAERAVDTAARVAAKYGLTTEEMLSPSHDPFLANARRELYAILRARGWSYPRIGKFANRDHSSVMTALNKKKKRKPRLRLVPTRERALG